MQRTVCFLAYQFGMIFMEYAVEFVNSLIDLPQIPLRFRQSLLKSL
jgi:hypothetical protein